MAQNKKHHSITTQFFALLVILGLGCAALFLVMHTVVERRLEDHFLNPEVQDRAAQERVNSLQDYVSQHQLAASDWEELAQWMAGQPLTLMEVYREDTLMFSSYASNSDALWDGEVSTPYYYDWVSYYTVQFSDGPAEVLMYSNDTFQFSSYAVILEVVVCAGIFLLGFLIVFQRAVRYIRQINREVQAMENGDLDHPVTLRGNNDLTGLAESLDAMRLALREHQAREAKTYAANQALITEMSHDLRTPLTTLLIYTEILRYQKYQDEEQLHQYLRRIDEKAHQIKQLAENILDYSLASKYRSVTLEAPVPAQEIFGPLLYETTTYLEHHGRTFHTQLTYGTGRISIHPPYIRRILDNISSNLLKYADPDQPIQIRSEERDGRFLLSFQNEIAQPEPQEESTHVGLISVQSMMEKMGGSCRTDQAGCTFSITLCFPVSDSPSLSGSQPDSHI